MVLVGDCVKTERKKDAWMCERQACVTVGDVQLDLNVVHDVTQCLGTLLDTGQLGLAQLLTDQVRDAFLADADRNAEEDLV